MVEETVGNWERCRRVSLFICSLLFPGFLEKGGEKVEDKKKIIGDYRNSHFPEN